MATLKLNLIKQWFDLTLKGIKKEEYRNITPFWTRRLICMENGNSLTNCYSEKTIEWLCYSLQHWEGLEYNSIEEVLTKFHIKFKKFENTEFRNGYKSIEIVPRFIIENKGVTGGIGKEEWGFVGETPKFIILHGKIIKKFNAFN